MQAFAADGTGEHLHRGLIPQLTDPNGAQTTGASGKQVPVPVVQRGQSEGNLQGAGGLKQDIQ